MFEWLFVEEDEAPVSRQREFKQFARNMRVVAQNNRLLGELIRYGCILPALVFRRVIAIIDI